MDKPVEIQPLTTTTRIYVDDVSRLDSLLGSLLQQNPKAARSDVIRHLLDRYEAQEAES